jgi:hypothetical protein
MVREAPPAFFTHPPLGDSIGDDVADWVGHLQLGNGEFFVPDDNQRSLLRAMFAGPPGSRIRRGTGSGRRRRLRLLRLARI